MSRSATEEAARVLRAPREGDAPAIVEVIRARHLADLGFPDFVAQDLADEWSQPEFDLAADAIVCVEGDGTIAGYAAIRRTTSLAVVDPEKEGRGHGAVLLGWTRERERALGRAFHRQVVGNGSERAARLLKSSGYEYQRCYWRMVRALADPPAEPAPPGITFRALHPELDAQAVYALDADSFDGAEDYVPMSFETFRTRHLQGHDLDAELSLVAESGEEIVAVLLASRSEHENAGHIDVLAVAPAYQGGGIGTSLLHSAFHGFAQAGLREAQLGVASSNPRALALYERLGMRPRFHNDVYAQAVDPG